MFTEGPRPAKVEGLWPQMPRLAKTGRRVERRLLDGL